ncbi:MAG: hypothetical protein OHK006_08570 [Thermodesulfovibrionales bacterium]
MQIPSYLLNEKYDDRYFDVVNAVEEAKHVFFEGAGILGLLSAGLHGGRELKIGETGFGAGRVLVALMDYLEASGLRDLAIAYNSVELHPVAPQRMEAILAGFRNRCGLLIDLLVREYHRLDLARPGWQQLRFVQPFGDLTLNLYLGEALEMVQALAEPCDAWFLDGHGPKKNPSIWRPELLAAIGEKTVSGGTAATYTVAVAVQRGLEAAGFAVEQRPGFGGKKAVLRGVKV